MAERTITKPETEKRERIRGPNLSVLVDFMKGASSKRALKLADRQNLVLASNKRMDWALVETDEWKRMEEAFMCWTGTMAGYRAPGAKLGKFINYTDPIDGQQYVFPVPEQYRREKNAILVAEHPDYSLVKDGKSLVVSASKVDCILQFPEKDGWYRADSVHGIPTGEYEDSDNRSRCLFRVKNRVGLVARDVRGDGCGGHYTSYILLDGKFYDCGPCNSLGVVVESPALPSQKAVLEIVSSTPERLRALFEKFSSPERVAKLQKLPKKELLRIAEEFAEALKGATLKE